MNDLEYVKPPMKRQNATKVSFWTSTKTLTTATMFNSFRSRSELNREKKCNKEKLDWSAIKQNGYEFQNKINI